MYDKNANLLDELITDQITYIGKSNPDDDGYSNMIDDLVKTYNLRMDEQRISNDAKDKKKRRSVEYRLNKAEIELKTKQFEADSDSKGTEQAINLAQLDEKIKDRRSRIIIELAGIGIPIIFYSIWMRKGFKFEETGTFTSQTFRGLFNRFRPTK